MAVVAGEVWPPVAGNIYCSMIDACQEMFDLRRADEWTAALSVWWNAQPDMVTFTGQCLVHRAEILHLRGAWPQAVEETRQACERFTHAADTYATGAAWYQQAELFRVGGDFPAAEGAYREANRWGHEPQPGLAMLWHAAGKSTAAEAAIRRVVGETTDRFRRAKLLPAYVEIILAIGDVPAARDAASELTEISSEYDMPALHAIAGHALGAVLLADGDAQGALVALRRAWNTWRDLNAPYEAARVRVLIALGCRALGDEDSATLELDAAGRVFRQLGATPELGRTDTLLRKQIDPAAHGLTGRELQVLRLVAAGKTNRAIASDRQAMFEAVRLQPGERVLDVGCGYATTTIEAAERVSPSGRAVGVDVSPAMLHVARQRVAAAGPDNIELVEADAQAYPFEPASFDAVISRFGTMFFEDPEAAFGSLARALRPGGRLAFACWQGPLQSEWVVVALGAAVKHVGRTPDLGSPDAPGPWAFADADRVTRLMQAGGFADVTLEPVTRPQRVGTDVDDVVRFVLSLPETRQLFAGLPQDVVAGAVDALHTAFAPYTGTHGVVMDATAWLVSGQTGRAAQRRRCRDPQRHRQPDRRRRLRRLHALAGGAAVHRRAGVRNPTRGRHPAARRNTDR